MNILQSRKSYHRHLPLRHLPLVPEKKAISLTKIADDKQAEKDGDYAVQICRRFLTVLGVWRPRYAGRFSWRHGLSNVLVIVCYFFLWLRLFPTGLYIIMDEKDPRKMFVLSVRWFISGIAAAKYTLLRQQRRDIDECMNHMKSDWLGVDSLADKNIMRDYSRYGHLVTSISVAFTFFGATWYAILPFAIRRVASRAIDGNLTAIVNTTSPRTFGLPSHFGFSIATKTPMYEIIYACQEIATCMVHAITIACYSLAVAIVMHACGRLKILVEMIKRLVDDNEDRYGQRISLIVRHHVRTLRFIASAEKMLRGICLIELASCTIVLCCMGYINMMQWRMEKKNVIGIMVYSIFFVTFTFNIFSFCFIGELLTQQCLKVGEVTYMIDWHRLPGKQALDLSLIIATAHSPVTLTAGGAVQLSFICFANVVKTSVGYLNMLRTVMD